MKHIALTLILALGISTLCQGINPIKLNQVGYYPNDEKVAVLEAETKAQKATLVDAKGKTVWTGKVTRKATSPWSGKVRSVVDFSSVTKAGNYTLKAGRYSQPVVIAQHAFHDINIAAIKSYYLQRTGMPIEEKYAGVYARPAAHPDTMVLVHPSAANEARPAGTVISSPYGWYDAGDFNKYIVNSGFTVGMLLLAYQQEPEYFDKLNLNIPESGNDVPDFLDEIMYNLRWMITMQDPTDGGVYHKLTTPSFEGFIMPIDAHQQRYVVQKSTAATLDYAASMALAARIYRKYPEHKAFCDEAMRRAELAYAWAVQHPYEWYDQPGYNKTCQPQVSTGMYPDELVSIADEFFWAATELYLATSQTGYLMQAKQFAPNVFALPVWGELSGLAMFEWCVAAQHTNSIVAQQMAQQFRPLILATLDDYMQDVATSCFQAPFGNRAEQFIWGSNAEMCAGMGVSLLVAYQLTGDKKYLTGALENANYLMGCNALGYCFITGFGTQQVMHPHQRISSADGIEAPLPGFLAGGPNRGQQDGLNYPSSAPDESYLDEEPSYASNEIAINWNAYLVNLLAGLDANL